MYMFYETISLFGIQNGFLQRVFRGYSTDGMGRPKPATPVDFPTMMELGIVGERVFPSIMAKGTVTKEI